MAQKTRTELKAFFETGDVPTQAEFIDLIDSMVNILSDNVQSWVKLTIGFADFQPDIGFNKEIVIFSIPSGFELSRFILKPSIAFTGGLISASEMTIIDSVTSTDFVNTIIDVFQAPGNNIGRVSPAYIFDDVYTSLSAVATDVTLAISVTGGNMNDLVAGSIDIYYLLTKIPV